MTRTTIIAALVLVALVVMCAGCSVTELGDATVTTTTGQTVMGSTVCDGWNVNNIKVYEPGGSVHSYPVEQVRSIVRTEVPK